jgi:hypothetical protein
VRPSCCHLSFLRCTLKTRLGRSPIIGTPQRRSGAAKLLAFKLSTLCAEHKARMARARKEPHHPGRKSSFCAYKAGSEFFPVRSGAAKLLSF